IALNALSGAGIGILSVISEDSTLRSAILWTLGSVGGADWFGVMALTILVVAGAALLLPIGRQLNALLLGEREAESLGVDVRVIKRRAIIGSAVAVGAAVAVSGVIGFIGLVVPHLIRIRWGPDHRLLLPASALGGALLVLWADTAARTVVAPQELPIGVLTAVIGAPYFIWLLLSQQSSADA
ncbi:MAG: iron ABC transporter permease, partial [Myxococcales bacterium]|nr:iron ABC transporter permease [Myxococcales bacterium]